MAGIRTGGKIYKDEAAPGPMVLMLLTAERVPNYLKYSDSKLTPVVRVKVAYREIDKNRNNREVQYEEYWYADGNPVGLVRHCQFVPHGCQIMLRVNQQQIETSEMEPLANALVRLYLDTNLNDNVLYSCIVPDQSFNDMLTAFKSQRFFAPGVQDVAVALDPSINLPLHSATSGINKVLQFGIQ
jgi:hypothetical protein